MSEPLHLGEPRRRRMLGNLVDPHALLRTAKMVREPAPGKRRMAMGMQVSMAVPKRALGKLLKRVRKAFNIESANAKKKTHSRAEFNAELASFEDWRARNPAKSVKVFYAQRKKTQIASGAAQSTFGADLKSGRAFEKSGVSFFQDLIGFGLKPTDTCVDYGCGTLRIGQHVMKYLVPGNYWGFDIADWLLEDGKNLVGSKLLAEKQPQLRVISRESVREVAARKPAMLFSAKVMQHVHPSELAEYFENIMTIVGTTGQAIIDSKWSDSETVQYRVNGWAHGIATIRDLVSQMGGKMEIIKEGVQSLPLEGAGHAKKGTIRIVHKSSARAK